MAHKKCLAKITSCDCIHDDIEELKILRKKHGVKKIEEFYDRLCQINGECEELLRDIDLWLERRRKEER